MKTVTSCCLAMLALVLLAACEREELMVQAVDDSVGEVATKTLTVNAVQYLAEEDNTPPTVTVLSPTDGAVVGPRPKIEIRYADEGSGVDLKSISVEVDGHEIMLMPLVSAGEGTFDVKLDSGLHVLTVSVKDLAGNETMVEVEFIVEGPVFKLLKLHSYPNPSRGSTAIVFELSQQARISIKVYDFTTANLVTTIVEDEMDAGVIVFRWDGTTEAGDGGRVANGAYLCEVIAKTDNHTISETFNITLLRE